VSGSNTISSAGNYGSKGVTSSTNQPGSRYESSLVLDSVGGALFVFGGVGSGSSMKSLRASYPYYSFFQ